MARPTMAALIDRTRRLIGDTGATQVFLDDDVQNALDRRRTEQRHVPLTSSPTFQSGGSVLYQDFYSNVENWEDDVLLQDVSFTSITATTAEPIVGHWYFATQPAGFAVRATGKTYDLYGSAADLLEAWAAQVKLDFDFQSGRDQYSRSQKSAMLLDLAKRYRSQALVQTTIIQQSEMMPDSGSAPAVVYPTYTDDFGW